MLDMLVNLFSSTIETLSKIFGNNYFLGIILLTIIIRFLLLPVNIFQEINTQNIEKMIENFKKLLDNPQLAKDKQALFMKMIPIYEQSKVRPFFGIIVPSTIQLVILFTLFYAIKFNEHIQNFEILWLTLGKTDPFFILSFIYLALTFTYHKFFSIMKVTIIHRLFSLLFFGLTFILPSTITIYWIIGLLFTILTTPISKHYLKKNKKSSN